MYQALYRKWRPRTFSDVSGQSHVTRTLAHEIESGRLSHAYLFTGSRGTGKTTCAKILSKAVNCLSPIDGNPCNECEICKGIDAGSILDVIEIDAASNNGIDNIRDLREEANFTPVKAKYRVYIIDEVHMLSIGAFNALLKILEEPPSYVIFILATTEVHKLPQTILSRCQRFDFKHISPEDISERLMFVAEKEGLSLTEEAASLIARIADGALRDALSLLDRCSAASSEITAEIVSKSTGLTGRDYLFDMASCIKNKDISSALSLLDNLHNDSCNMEVLCSELIEYFRNLMITKVSSNSSDIIICTEEELSKMKELCEGMTLETILSCLSSLENSLANIKRGLNKRIETEMVIIRLCSPSLDNSADALLRRISELEAKIAMISSGNFVPSPSDKNDNSKVSKPDSHITINYEADNSQNINNPDVSSQQNVPEASSQNEQVPVNDGNVQNNTQQTQYSKFSAWPDIVKELYITNKALSSLLSMSKAVISGNTVLISSDNSVLSTMISNPAYLSDLQQATVKVTGQNLSFKVQSAKQEISQEKKNLDRFVEKINKFNGQ